MTRRTHTTLDVSQESRLDDSWNIGGESKLFGTMDRFVELCDTEVCFLHIQPTGTNVRLPKIHKILPEVDLEFSRSAGKVSLGTLPIDNAAPYYPNGNIVCDHSCDEREKSNEPRVCHRLGST